LKPPGIHARLLVTAFLIISATSFSLGYMGVKMFHEFVRQRFDERFAFLARYLALNAELGILIDQRVMLGQLADNLLAEQDVVRVEIFNRSGDRLAHAEKHLPGPLSEVSAPVRLKASSDESQTFGWGGMPAALDDRDPVIGEVRITYSASQIRSMLAAITVRFVVSTAGLTALCLVIFFFISRSMVAPLTRLAQIARKIGAGEVWLRTATEGPPETREVSIAFNAMLDSLQRSREAVEKANQEMARQNLLAEMGKFSMMIAHEIKNPLSIIKSSFDVLRKDPFPDANPVIIGYIDEEIRRINSLIEDFLSFAKPSKPAFRIADANQMLKDCLERFMRMPPAKNMTVEVLIPEGTCLSYLDPDLCRRAVDNILKNAAEACGEEGAIRVTAQCLEECWQVEIADDGEGIADDALRKIFDPFFTTRTKGTGLGLAYTAQVIGAHGGRIAAENRKTGGAAFIIEIPREPKMIDLPVSGEVKE
jgi:signal transduction histidine kinase